MGLRFDPVGGGQFKAAVQQIMEAERQPVHQLEQRKATEQAKLKLFQDFKTRFAGLDKALGELADFRKFREFKVDLGDGSNIVSATVDKDRAQPGTYDIEVKELAGKTSVISNGFEDPDKPVLGMGYIVLYTSEGKKEIYVDPDTSSLRNIASQINADPKSSIRAAVVKDTGNGDEPWKLILSAKKEGGENDINFPDFYFLDGEHDLYIDDKQKAKDGLLSVNGFEINNDTNDINDFAPGVNLHLKQAKPGTTFTMNITADTQKMSGKMKGLVDQLNTVFDFITKQNQVNEDSNTREMFTGDTGLQNIEFRLRNLMHEGFGVGDPNSSGFRRKFLNEMGVVFNKTGQLQFDENKFEKEIEKDYDGVSEAISGPFGFSFQMRTVLTGYNAPGNGLLALREQGLQSRIKEIDRQIDDKNRLLDKKQQDLVGQFSRLEASLGQMQQQQQYLAATLPGAGGGGNLISQLLGG